jgi:oligopeptide/dipeptide ABC transporter ATP-binding protein
MSSGDSTPGAGTTAVTESIDLRVEDLTTVVGSGDTERKVVDGVSFTLAPGETVAIVGESGSGKSMTALSIMGLLPKGAARTVGGRVLLGGENLLTLSAKALRARRGARIAYMPQDPVSGLNPSLTIGRQVTEPLLIHSKVSRREAAQRAVDLLTTVGIPNLPATLDAYPHQLSGGMRQRVLLAMCLIASPSVLIADEPTTAVDVTTQEQIIDLLAELQKERQLAILLITHDLGVVSRIAKTVAVMYAGRVVDHGSAEKLFAQPQHPYTRGLLRSVAFDAVPPRTKMFALSGMPAQAGDRMAGCAFAPRCEYAVEKCEVEDPRLVPAADGEAACLRVADGTLPPWTGIEAGT